MSVTMRVFLENAKLPTARGWSAAIRAEGFDLSLDDVDLRTFSGFLPCDVENVKSGFEYYFAPRSADHDADATKVGARDVVVDLVTHSDMREALCSVIAAAVLCSMADGVLWDTEGNEWSSASGALDWARDVEVEMRRNL